MVINVIYAEHDAQHTTTCPRGLGVRPKMSLCHYFIPLAARTIALNNPATS